MTTHTHRSISWQTWVPLNTRPGDILHRVHRGEIISTTVLPDGSLSRDAQAGRGATVRWYTTRMEAVRVLEMNESAKRRWLIWRAEEAERMEADRERFAAEAWRLLSGPDGRLLETVREDLPVLSWLAGDDRTVTFKLRGLAEAYAPRDGDPGLVREIISVLEAYTDLRAEEIRHGD